MPSYHFALNNSAGDHEVLGDLTMANDEEALSFGRGVIQDIIREHTPSYVGSVMEITEGARRVASIPLNSETIESQKKVGRGLSGRQVVPAKRNPYKFELSACPRVSS